MWLLYVKIVKWSLFIGTLSQNPPLKLPQTLPIKLFSSISKYQSGKLFHFSNVFLILIENKLLSELTNNG